MSTLFAFLHHLAAFTLVAALAIEFVLIGQIQINDAAGGQGLLIPLGWICSVFVDRSANLSRPHPEEGALAPVSKGEAARAFILRDAGHSASKTRVNALMARSSG